MLRTKKEKIYNKTKSSLYSIISTASPYFKVKNISLKKPKFIFRKSFELANKFFKKKIIDKKVLDIGSANGEFAYFFNKITKNSNTFLGVDIHKPFTDLSNKKFSNKNITFINKNFFDLKSKYDLIFSHNTLAIFPDIRPALKKIIYLLNKNGVAVINGRFNEADIDAIIKFKEEKTSKLWRSDFNIHSQKTINNYLKKYHKSIIWKFKKYYIDTNIKKREKNPDIYHYTFKDSDKNIRITSGLMQLHDNYFMIIKKFK